MAWQLIYTSAPRLLEAGRTGFGTVARHRGVGDLVAGAVERFSQFARLPGLGPRRVIYSHRIITAGASQVHVFSSIRDAGSDYTGRTNHLAHHLIAEAREVKMAAEAGITPADIFVQMQWRKSWNEPPRFLEPLEEVSLMGLRSRMLGSAWERLTGRSDWSALPKQNARCFIVLPGDAEALPIIQESLSKMGTDSMQVTFTTHLEPTDEAADFRWVAMNANSPLRQQADGIARPVLDLTQPQSLSKMEAVSSAAPARTARESYVPETVTAYAPMQTAATEFATTSSFMESLHPPPKASRGSFTGLVIATALVIGAGIAAYSWLDQQPKKQPANSELDHAKRVESLWKKHHLALPITATWLKGQADVRMIESHERALQQLMQSLQQPLVSAEVLRPESTQDEFMDFLQSYAAWQRSVNEAVRKDIWASAHVDGIKVEAQVSLDQDERLWKSLAKNFERPPVHPEILKAEISRQTLKKLNQSVMPQGLAEDWRDVLTMSLMPMPHWPDLWVELSHLPAFPAALTTANMSALKAAASEVKAPTWLQQLAVKRLKQTSDMDEAEANSLKAAEQMLKPKEATIQIATADGPASLHPRFILLVTDERSLQQALETSPKLPVQEEMQILVGQVGESEKSLVRWRSLGGPGIYRKSFTESEFIEIKEQRLTQVPASQSSWRILGRSLNGNEVLFEVLIMTSKNRPVHAWQNDRAFTFQSLHDNQRTTLDAAAARWLSALSFAGMPPHLRLQNLGDVKQTFRVQLVAGEVVIEQESKPSQSMSATIRATSIKTEIESLRQGIRIDEERKTQVAQGNLAKREKEDSQIRAQQAISSKEMRIMQMEEELRQLNVSVVSDPALVGIPAGRYALMAVILESDGSEAAFRLCELTITSQQAKNEP